MIDRRRILELYRRGNSVALVTLVRVEGSSYRQVGARLLIAADGTYAGAISGGCLEAEVLRKAQWKVSGGAVVERYSTLFDDTADVPYGLGCGGTVDLLFEPADTPEFHALMAAMEASLGGETQYVDTVLPNKGKPLRRVVQSLERTKGSADDVFAEVLLPPQRLIVCGAGDDAQPLVRLGALLGWSVAVVDARVQWARSERFPEAETVGTSLDVISLQEKDAIVLMTHSYDQDRDLLLKVLPRCPRYIGLLGARHRSSLLLREAAERLSWSLERVCTNLFAPLGLDLGGDGAEAIALATAGEIQACIEGKLPHSRRMTPAMVEAQLEKFDHNPYLQPQCSL